MYIALDATKHTNLTFKPFPDFTFAKKQFLVPLLLQEVVAASQEYPIIFPDENSVIPYALMGLAQKNIFVQDRPDTSEKKEKYSKFTASRWLGKYVPCIFSHYPFALLAVQSKEQTAQTATPRVVLALDPTAPQLAHNFHDFDPSKPDATPEEVANALAEADGTKEENTIKLFEPKDAQNDKPVLGFDPNRESNVVPSRFLQNISEGLARQQADHHRLLPASNLLTEGDIFRVHDVPCTPTNPKYPRQVANLRIISQDKVFILPEATLGAWVKFGAMQIVYAHWFSLRHLGKLVDALNIDELKENNEIAKKMAAEQENKSEKKS